MLLPCCMYITPLLAYIASGVVMGICMNAGCTVVRNRRKSRSAAQKNDHCERFQNTSKGSGGDEKMGKQSRDVTLKCKSCDRVRTDQKTGEDSGKSKTAGKQSREVTVRCKPCKDDRRGEDGMKSKTPKRQSGDGSVSNLSRNEKFSPKSKSNRQKDTRCPEYLIVCKPVGSKGKLDNSNAKWKSKGTDTQSLGDSKWNSKGAGTDDKWKARPAFIDKCKRPTGHDKDDNCAAEFGYVRARKTKNSGVNIRRNKFGCEVEY